MPKPNTLVGYEFLKQPIGDFLLAMGDNNSKVFGAGTSQEAGMDVFVLMATGPTAKFYSEIIQETQRIHAKKLGLVKESESVS